MAKKAHFNRLYDTRHAAGVKAVRADALFEKAVEQLVSLGYNCYSEAVYDSVFCRLNALSPGYEYPTLSGVETSEKEADRELARALQALTKLRTDLGVLASDRQREATA